MILIILKQQTGPFYLLKLFSDGEGFKNWIHSTYIDLSNYSGTAYIAFKYKGNGNVNFDGTYELDNVKIIAKD